MKPLFQHGLYICSAQLTPDPRYSKLSFPPLLLSLAPLTSRHKSCVSAVGCEIQCERLTLHLHPLQGCQSGHVCWGRAFLCIVTVTPIFSLDLQSRLRKYRIVARARLYQLALQRQRGPPGQPGSWLAHCSHWPELRSNDPRPASPWSPAIPGHPSPLSV